MYSSTPKLDGNERVQGANSGLKWSQIRIFVREYSKIARIHPEAYTGRNVFLGGLKPSVTLCLCNGKYVYDK